MKRLRIFPKTFLYTLGLMLFITIIAHGLIYFFTGSLALSSTAAENGTIQVAFNLSDYIADRIISILPISVLICLILSVTCSFLFAKAITKPIRRISAETTRMALLEKDAKCNIRSGDEIGTLADNINGLYQSLLSTIRNLENEIDKVRESERSKVDFLRAASHELKTPVTAVNAMLENMILGVGKYQNHELYLGKCKELTEQLGEMIQEVLDASKLSLIAENEVTVTVNLADFIAALCEPYHIIARARGIDFCFDTSDSFDVNLSPGLFGRAFSNILANAVSYTEKGHTINVYFKDKNLIIENECAPIPPEHLEHLFEPFYRPEFARARDSGGNGLGLYIVDTIFSVLNVSYQFLPMQGQQGMRFCIQL